MLGLTDGMLFKQVGKISKYFCFYRIKTIFTLADT